MQFVTNQFSTNDAKHRLNGTMCIGKHVKVGYLFFLQQVLFVLFEVE